MPTSTTAGGNHYHHNLTAARHQYYLPLLDLLHDLREQYTDSRSRGIIDAKISAVSNPDFLSFRRVESALLLTEETNFTVLASDKIVPNSKRWGCCSLFYASTYLDNLKRCMKNLKDRQPSKSQFLPRDVNDNFAVSAASSHLVPGFDGAEEVKEGVAPPTHGGAAAQAAVEAGYDSSSSGEGGAAAQAAAEAGNLEQKDSEPPRYR